MEYIDIIKSYLIYDFNKNKIIKGYHNINFNTIDKYLEIFIECTNIEHNYLGYFDIDIFNKIIPLESKIIENNNNKLIIKSNLNQINNNKVQLYKLLPQYYIYICIKNDINDTLLNQIKYHQIDNNLNQSIFDMISEHNYDYYLELSNNNIININYDNEELLICLLSLNHIDVSYVHFYNAINNNSIKLLDRLIDKMNFSNAYENYELLKFIINNYANEKFIDKLLSKFINFKDWGIISELIINKNINNKIFEVLIKDKRININIYNGVILNECIEYNNICILEYIIKNKIIKVTDNHLILAKQYNNYKIYNILYNNLIN